LTMHKKMLQKIAYAAIFVAIYVVLEMYVAWNISPTLRITFSLMAVALAGATLGWKYGAMVGLVGDLLMFFLKNNYAPYMPQFTISAVMVGVIFGLFVYKKENLLVRVIVCQVFATLVIHMLWDTWALAVYYGNFWGWFMLRAWGKLATMVVLIILEYMILLAFRRRFNEVQV